MHPQNEENPANWRRKGKMSRKYKEKILSDQIYRIRQDIKIVFAI